MNSITTTTPQAILIKNWHIYFENGQTRRIKNLTYSLSPVDHSSITRKALLRKGAAGHTALAVFSELVGLAARCPQRGLLVEGTGPITSEHIAAITGLGLSDVEAGLELLASKEVAWITHEACPKKLIVSGSLRKGRKGRPLQPELVHVDNPHADSPDLHIEWEYAIVDKGNGPETERRLPKGLKNLLDAEKEEDTKQEDVACHKTAPRSNTPPAPAKPVACHTNKPASRMPENVARHILRPKPTHSPTVACHTEGVDVQSKPITVTEADRRAVDRFVQDLETTGLLGNATVKVKRKAIH